MEIFIVRHGERADRHPTNREYPIPYDPCLTERGLLQAQQTAKFISTLAKNPVHVASSPFFRCIQTAAIISNEFGVPFHIEEGFGEFVGSHDFSQCPFDNLTYQREGIQAIDQLRQRMVINQHVLRPKFPQSYEDVTRRIGEAWNAYLRKGIQADTLIIVSHLQFVWEIVEFFGARPDSFSDNGYCHVVHARMQNGRFEVFINGKWNHLSPELHNQ